MLGVLNNGVKPDDLIAGQAAYSVNKLLKSCSSVRARKKKLRTKTQLLFFGHFISFERQVGQSIKRRDLEVEVRGSKHLLSSWCWGWVRPNQPYPTNGAPMAITLLKEYEPLWSILRMTMVCNNYHPSTK